MPLKPEALLNASLRDCQPVLCGRWSGVPADVPYRASRRSRPHRSPLQVCPWPHRFRRASMPRWDRRV